MPSGRDFFKALTADLDDPRVLALTWEQRGVLDAALKLQARISTVPGRFLSPTGSTLTIEQIAALLHAGDANGRVLVGETFAACAEQDPPILRQAAKGGGWEVPEWLTRYSFASTHAATREADRQRKAAQRAREKAEKLDRERAAKVTPMRPRAAERDEG